MNNTCRYDFSNSQFTINFVPPTPSLTSPNGGEHLNVGCSFPITWNPASFFSPVNLFYSADNGVTWNNIYNNVANTGSHGWQVPDLPGHNFLIKAVNSASPAIYDVSNATFTILPQEH